MPYALNVDLLRTFHAIARLGQFRAAARHLNRSPAAVSTHVQRLEEMTGGRLFERDNQGVSVTAAGERLLRQTSDFLAAHDRIVAGFNGGGAERSRLRFGLPDEYAGRLLRRILPLFAVEHPHVELELETAPSEALRDMFDRRRIDIALLVRPCGDGGAHDEALCRTAPVWVGPAAGRALIADPLPLALHADLCPYRRLALDSLATAGRTWRAMLISPSAVAVESCIEAGLALGVVDRSRVTPAMSILGPAEGLPALPAHELVLVCDRETGNPGVQGLARMLRENFRL